LYLLLIRLGKFTAFRDAKNIDDLLNIGKNYATKTNCNSDIKHFALIYKYLLPIIDNNEELFFKRSMKTAYRSQEAYYGISNLIIGNADEVTKNKFEKIKQKVDNGMTKQEEERARKIADNIYDLQ
jgi:hypothetical protein